MATALNADGTPKIDPATGLPMTAAPATTTPAVATAAPVTAASPTTNPDGSPMSIMQQASAAQATDNSKTPSITPILNTFDESKGVAGRVADITSSNSPLMQRAAVQGTQIAAERGLVNSSLAAEASQNAVLAAATPIATADASLYAQVQAGNQTASNSIAQTNAQLGESGRQFDITAATNKQQFDQNMALQQTQLDTQKDQFAKQLGVTVQDLDLRRDTLTSQQQQFLATLDQQKATLAQNASQFAATQAQQLVLQKMTGDQQVAVANIENQFKSDIQSNVNISNAWGTTMQNIQAIQNNANLDGGAKQTLIQNTLDSFASFTDFWKSTTASDVDVTPLLNFTQTGAAANGAAGSNPGAGISAPPTPPGVYLPGQPYYPPEGGQGG